MQDACRRRLPLPSVKLRTNVSRETYAEKQPADGALVPSFLPPLPLALAVRRTRLLPFRFRSPVVRRRAPSRSDAENVSRETFVRRITAP